MLTENLLKSHSESRQQSLFPTKHRTAATSRAAFEKAKPKQPTLKLQILELLRQAQGVGMIREELATSLGTKESSICSPVRQLLDDGSILNTGRTRATSLKKQAYILVLPEFLLANPFVVVKS